MQATDDLAVDVGVTGQSEHRPSPLRYGGQADLPAQHGIGGQRLFRNCVLTDGMHYVAEEAGAYWPMDAVASYQPAPRRHADSRPHDIQSWRLEVSPDHSAVLSCRADSGFETRRRPTY